MSGQGWWLVRNARAHPELSRQTPSPVPGEPRCQGRPSPSPRQAPLLPLSVAITDVFISLINELCKLTSSLLYNCH